jgi:DNA-binding response OmpR family regulator
MNVVQKKILVIDHDKDTTRIITEALEAKGLEVLIISDPKKALAKSKVVAPDLMFISFDQPGTNGIEVSKSIRSIESLRTVPIILLVQNTGEFDKYEAAFLGIRNVFIKPLNTYEIISKALEILSEQAVLVKSEEVTQSSYADISSEKPSGESIPEREEINVESMHIRSKLLKTPENGTITARAYGKRKKSQKAPIYTLFIVFIAFGIAGLLSTDTGREFFNKTFSQKELAKNDINKTDAGKAEAFVSYTTKKDMTLGQTIYSVHVGVFFDEKQASLLADSLEQKGYEAYTRKVVREDKRTVYRVLVGKFDTENKALAQSKLIRMRQGIESFVYHY